MAEFTTVIREKERMCKHNKVCDACPISSNNNTRGLSCASLAYKYPQEAEELIMTWAKENPIQTNLDKYKEVFGSEIEIAPGGCDGFVCPNIPCEECEYNHFWEQEYIPPTKESK